MKKNLSLILLIGIGIFLFAGNAFSYTITVLDPYSSAINSSGDRIGNIIFEIYRMDMTVTGNQLAVDIYSNYTSNGYTVHGWETHPADLKIDFDYNGSHQQYGVAFWNHDNLTQGKLYQTSEWYESGYDRPLGIDYHWHEDQWVNIKTATEEAGNAPVNWYSTDSTNPNYRINTVLNMGDFLPSDFKGNIDIFYGGASCANDYIAGQIPAAPEPATISLLGLGLLGLLGFKKRKERK